MMMMLTGERKKKFLITMIVITACATMVNYGLYSILNTYLLKPSNAYEITQINIISVGIIIGVVAILMFFLIPKESADEMLRDIQGGSEKSPEQQLQDMIDDELEKEKFDNN